MSLGEYLLSVSLIFDVSASPLHVCGFSTVPIYTAARFRVLSTST